MHLRLKTKITLIMALLMLAVVGVNSALYVATLTRQVIRQADDHALTFSQQVLSQANSALIEAAKAGGSPASSTPESLRSYVQNSPNQNSAFTALIPSEMAFSSQFYEVSITDSKD